MSVLVAIKGKDRVVVGVDTRMSCGNSYSDSYKSRPKALHVNKEKTVIVGGVGNITLVDLFSSIVEDHLKTGEDIDRKYILRYMVPELIMQIDAYQIMPRDRDNTYIDGVLFLGIKDKGYVITGNATVEELVDYVAIGSGQDAASGSLYTTAHFPMSIEDKVAMAVKAAGATVSTVSTTPVLGDTKGKIFKPL